MKFKSLIFALLLPLLALGALTGYKAYRRAAGTPLVLPITGYDPRDLLSGHYLTYRLDFKEALCNESKSDAEVIFVCVMQETDGRVEASRLYDFDDSAQRHCTAVLRGRCDGGRFLAGVERFYIPEEHSRELDRVVRAWESDASRAKLVVSVGADGRAVVKDLWIDGRPWQEFIAKPGN